MWYWIMYQYKMYASDISINATLHVNKLTHNALTHKNLK